MGKFNKGASTNFLHMLSDFGFMLVSFLIAALVSGMPFFETLKVYGPI